MSMPRKETATCPGCGKEIEFTVWQSINTSMDFAIPDIISGKLFEVNCGSCGFSTHVDYPILFNDMIHHVMIYYVGQENVEETIETIGKIPFSALKCRNRVVTSQEALREKTAIFNDGLDDRIAEMIKVFVIGQLEDQLGDRELDGVFFHGGNAEKAPRLEFLMDGGTFFTELNPDAYRDVEEQYREALDKRGDNDFVVDLNWAINFLEN